MFKSVMLSVPVCLVAASGAYAQTCPKIDAADPDRGQIHFQIADGNTGKLRAIRYIRTHLEPGNAYIVFGTSAPCQGCNAIPAQGQTQDCTIGAPIRSFFDWAVVNSQTFKNLPTIAMSGAIKAPSGTILLSQYADQVPGNSGGPCPVARFPGVTALHTVIEDWQTKRSLGVYAVRGYVMRHPNSSNFDFYSMAYVDLNTTYAGELQDGCQTNTTNKAGWYDSYWKLPSHTINFNIAYVGGGPILLNQGQ